MGRLSTASRPSPAIVVAVLALVAALAGTALAGTDATTSAINKKKVKKIVKKQVAKQIAGLTLPEGPPGEDAANLFAFVSDDLPAGNAVLLYGRGATAVDDPPGPDEDYSVTFNRSLRNCVAHANVGFGDPGGGGASITGGIASVSLSSGAANELDVTVTDQTSDASVDSSFMVSVFC